MSLRIVQLSDSHISHSFPQRSTDLDVCVKHINALEPAADIVIHTGDIAHDGLPEEYNTARDQLEQLDAPYFVMAGNRDNRRHLLDAFTDNCAAEAGEDWVQYSLAHLPVQLLMVDTVSVDSNKGKICQQRFAHIEQVLNKDKPALLFLHHPPYPATGIPDPYQYEDWGQVDKLGELLSGYDNIQGIYCGHVHRNIDGEIAGIPAGAITCIAGDLRKGEVSAADRTKPVIRVITAPSPGL